MLSAWPTTCASPRIQPGDTILDIGCGGGIDTILAARRTGPTGKVIGLDFLPEMLQRTANAAQEAGLHNIETLYGEMEAIPLPDGSVDLIISNGVINLSARKARVMAECARVLRPGGRLCVSDFTVDQDQLPADILTQPAAWAGCVAGALAEGDFVYKLEKAGFIDVRVLHREPVSIDDCALYPLFTDEVISLMRQLIPPQKQQAVAVAVVISASIPFVIATVTLPPASPVELLTAYYSASAQAYEQWWASAIHPAGVQLVDRATASLCGSGPRPWRRRGNAATSNSPRRPIGPHRCRGPGRGNAASHTSRLSPGHRRRGQAALQLCFL